MEERGLLSWTTQEYELQNKTSDWFWAVGIASGASAVVAIIFGNILFALLIVLAGGTLAYFAMRPPEMITVTIMNRGIKIKNEFFPYSNLKGFGLFTDNGRNELRVISTRFFMPVIRIPLGTVKEDDVRTALAEHLEEQEIYEHTAEKLADMLKL